MSKKNAIRVYSSPLTNTIFAGKMLKDGSWAAGKCDVTMDCIMAVVEHTLRFGQPLIVSKLDGTPEFKITVEKLNTLGDSS